MRVQLVATQPGLALYQVTGSDTAVVVDTSDMNAFDPVPTAVALEQDGWSTPESAFAVPQAWTDLAEAAVDDFTVVTPAPKKRTNRMYRAPNKVTSEISRGISAYNISGSALGVSPELFSLAKKLVSGASVGKDELEVLATAHAGNLGTPPTVLSSLSGSNIAYLLTGGSPGREWVQKIADQATELAAQAQATPSSPPKDTAPAAPTATPAATAPPAPTTADFGKQTTDPTDASGWVDVTKPHTFLPDSDDPTVCGVCGNTETDQIHDPAAVADFQKQLDDAAGSTPTTSPAPAPSAAPVTAGGFNYDPGCTYFGKMAGEDLLDQVDVPDTGMDDPNEAPPGADDAMAGEEDPSVGIGVTALLMKDPNDQWFEYDNGDWQPTEDPGENQDDVVQLDEESANSLADAIGSDGTDQPTDATPQPVKKSADGVYSLRISEELLFKNAEPFMNLELYDQLFAATPYVDPAIRSRNAAKQPRQGGGRFGSGGNSPSGTPAPSGGTVSVPATAPPVAGANAPGSSQDDATGSMADQIAQLSGEHELIGDVAGRIQQYISDNAGPSDSPSPTTESDTDAASVTAAGEPDPALAPPTVDAPTAGTEPDASATGPDASSVAPLYLALVDSEDTQAVLKLLAVIPADQASGQDVECYSREGSDWVNDPEDLTALQGPTPPPAVEITDQAELEDVKNQIAETSDSGTGNEAGAPADGTQPDSMAAAGILAAYYPDGEIAFATLTEHSPDEDGVLVASQRSGAILLPSYEGESTWPTDLRQRVSEFVAGVEASPKDVGNTERLRQYWEHGAGAAKIMWGQPNDWYRCVHHLEKFLGVRAKGYCALRHRSVLGVWPGQEDGGRHQNHG